MEGFEPQLVQPGHWAFPPRPQRGRSFHAGRLWRADWCLARSRDLWRAQGSGRLPEDTARLRPCSARAGSHGLLLSSFISSSLPLHIPVSIPGLFSRAGGKYLQRSPGAFRHPISIFSWDDSTGKRRPCHCSNSYRREKKTNLKSCLCKLGPKLWWCLSRTWFVMGESWPAKEFIPASIFLFQFRHLQIVLHFYKPIKHTLSVTESRPY